MPKCQRCDNESVFKTRKQEFCSDCFIRFVRSKQRKSMIPLINQYEKSPIEVVVPMNSDFNVSGYVNFTSSIALIDILCDFLGASYVKYYKIVVVFFVESQNSDDDFLVDLVKKRYQENVEVRRLDLMGFIKKYSVFEHLEVFNGAAYLKDTDQVESQSFEDYIAGFGGVSTREDLKFVLYWKLLFKYCEVESAGVVLLSNTSDNIATKILSNVVKGRGAEVNQILAEEIGNTKIFYPFKDVLSGEIIKYVELIGLVGELKGDVGVRFALSNQKVVNVKSATINELINDYLVDLEKSGYSTVATVLAMGSRLALPRGDLGRCPVCQFQMVINASSWWKTITVDSSPDNIQAHKEVPTGDFVDVCYGCLTTVNSVPGGLIWPRDDNIDEYILTDDEN